MNKDTIETSHEALIKDVVMIAARILLESGAEGTRVEDTMARIATKLGYPESNSFVTNTVIEFVLHNEAYPRLYRIKTRDTNLIKISQANEISRQITNGTMTLEEAKYQLEEIYVAKSIISVIGHAFVPSGDLATIIIAAVVPIVPGVLITNAIQDLFGGHMLMFTTKSLEALVTAFGIGAGVSSILILV